MVNTLYGHNITNMHDLVNNGKDFLPDADVENLFKPSSLYACIIAISS